MGAPCYGAAKREDRGTSGNILGGEGQAGEVRLRRPRAGRRFEPQHVDVASHRSSWQTCPKLFSCRDVARDAHSSTRRRTSEWRSTATTSSSRSGVCLEVHNSCSRKRYIVDAVVAGPEQTDGRHCGQHLDQSDGEM